MQVITVFKKEDFRRWLKLHHKKERQMAVLVHKKHTGKPAPTHRELIEEAICFGWIDTTVKRVDEDTFMRRFAKRTKNSSWSDNTLRYAAELVKAGRMSEEGLKFYKLGLKKPTHDSGIPKNPEMPQELKRALAKNKAAMRNFEAFPPSAKKLLYRWLLSGKLPETREKRIRRIVEGVRNDIKNVILKTNQPSD